MKTSLLFFLALCGWATAQTPSPTPNYLKTRGDLAAFIPKEMRKNNVKALSIALVDGDKVIWCEGFGKADEKQKILATGDTLYRMGSVSKLFTATEILRLAAKKKLKLDAPIQKYIPQFSMRNRFDKTAPISPRSLLAHHSGLPGFRIKGMWGDQTETLEQLVSNLKEDSLVAPPQTFYKYSFLDYDLLGRVIEIQSRKDFATAMKENLLDPLGMDSSFFGAVPEGSHLAQGYRDGKELPAIPVRDLPMAGMTSSAKDMSNFLRFLFSDAGPGLEKMTEIQYPGLAMDFGHKVGLGWMLSGLETDGLEGMAWHDGAYPPYYSALAVLPKEKLGVVLLSNTSETQKMANDVAQRALKLMLEAKTGLKTPLDKPKINMPPEVKVPEETLDRYSGTYSALGQATEISRNGSILSAKITDFRLDLVPVAQNIFVPRFVLLILFPITFPQYPLEFSTVDGGEFAVLKGLPFPVPLEKIAPVPIPEAWKNRLGEYTVENSDHQLEFQKVVLGEANGFLTVSIRISMDVLDLRDKDFRVIIRPVSEDDAVVTGLFYGDGCTLHASEGKGPTRISYSGYTFVKKEAPPNH
jgi:CubicO group peptidase (beta-lactamase class C family)